MDLPTPDICHAALSRRDPAFDGRFFTCVTTTGIYCRPVCPARPPKPDNCRFVATRAEAEAAGFRACKRCRPDAALLSPAAAGSAASVARALRQLEAADPAPLPALAEKLGLSERHLRRLFARHMGASPVALAQAARLARALQLVDATDLPMAEVAAQAGFTSLRRFNELFAAVHHQTPRQRRAQRTLPMLLTLSHYDAGFAQLLIATTPAGEVAALDFSDFEARLRRLIARHHGAAATITAGPLPAAVAAALDRWFNGDLTALSALPLAQAGSPFQRRVWAALAAIPPGETRSYGEIARSLGQPGAARAVGLANSQNPIAIIIPCHRVIGASGSLTGYAGGVARKQWLLAHEASHVQSGGSRATAPA